MASSIHPSSTIARSPVFAALSGAEGGLLWFAFAELDSAGEGRLRVLRRELVLGPGTGGWTIEARVSGILPLPSPSSSKIALSATGPASPSDLVRWCRIAGGSSVANPDEKRRA